jgi:hypothetical protein
MKAIHLICRRDLDGVSLNNLKFDRETKLHRSGHWDIGEAEARALVGGWLYLHPTKSEKSEYGGTIEGFEVKEMDSLAHSKRIVFLVRRRLEGDGHRWRGRSDVNAFSGGAVPANYAHEQSPRSPTTD